MLNQSSPTIFPAAIAAGAALTGQINLGVETLHGILIPSNWTAAGLTFQVSIDGGATFYEMNDVTGAAVTMTVAEGTYVAVDPTLWRAVNCFKIRSGTLGSPVDQVSAVTLNLVAGPVV